MSSAPAVPDLAALRARVEKIQGRPSVRPVPTHPALSGLLQLQAGHAYAVDSASLVALLLAGPSGDGSWCGVVGSAELGLESAAALGVDLTRLLLVPEPGEQWLEVVAALVDVLDVVVVRAPVTPTDHDVSRLAARLRSREGVLVAWGDWPRADARLSLRDERWSGLGAGHGHLLARQATVEVRRGVGGPARERRLWLPGADGVVEQAHPEQQAPRLRSVG